uniref:Uncharacterized protein n=1 Tax=Zea mays TaxID=4577 RepID=A0A804NG31_MAIZE
MLPAGHPRRAPPVLAPAALPLSLPARGPAWPPRDPAGPVRAPAVSICLAPRLHAPGAAATTGHGRESRECYLSMFLAKKPDKADPNEARLSRFTWCTLFGEPLAAPAVANRLGNLYNKKLLVEALLHKRGAQGVVPDPGPSRHGPPSTCTPGRAPTPPRTRSGFSAPSPASSSTPLGMRCGHVPDYRVWVLDPAEFTLMTSTDPTTSTRPLAVGGRPPGRLCRARGRHSSSHRLCHGRGPNQPPRSRYLRVEPWPPWLERCRRRPGYRRRVAAPPYCDGSAGPEDSSRGRGSRPRPHVGLRPPSRRPPCPGYFHVLRPGHEPCSL